MDYFKKFCRKCTEDVHCCIFKDNSGFTFLGMKDARRIKSKIKKDYSYFLDYSPLPKKIISAIENDDPLLEGTLRKSQLDKNKRLLRLKTKKEGRCIFLDDLGKCEIYDIRPNICRIYPFWAIRLESGKLKVIEHDINSGCSVIGSLAKKNKDIEKSLSKKEKADVKSIAKEIKEESIDYKKNIRGFYQALESGKKV